MIKFTPLGVPFHIGGMKIFSLLLDANSSTLQSFQLETRRFPSVACDCDGAGVDSAAINGDVDMSTVIVARVQYTSYLFAG